MFPACTRRGAKRGRSRGSSGEAYEESSEGKRGRGSWRPMEESEEDWRRRWALYSSKVAHYRETGLAAGNYNPERSVHQIWSPGFTIDYLQWAYLQGNLSNYLSTFLSTCLVAPLLASANPG